MARSPVWLPLLMIAVLAALPTRRAAAETRRALIVGINDYIAVNPDTDRALPLSGALNDAQGMRSVLLANFGFKTEDILILRQEQATYDGIIQAIRQQLISDTHKGDIRLFYFAGHGSWVHHQSSRESDHKDETIVPVDANRGVPDITDKQLAGLFNAVLDKEAKLIAIFDSCHSGSVARGLPGSARTRMALPATVASIDSDEPVIKPGDRGALIFAAAHSAEKAVERPLGQQGVTQGQFSYALFQVLRSPDSQIESALQIFQRTRALMSANAATQEPVLDATDQRAARGFFDRELGGMDGRSVVALSGVQDGILRLDGGLALGLQPGAKLSRVGSGPAVQITVTEVRGMSLSLGNVRSGRSESLQPGDLFVIESYGAAQANALKVFIPTQVTREELIALQRALRLLQRDRALFISDPTTGEAATHVLARDETSWFLHDRFGKIKVRFSGVPRAAAVHAALRGVRAPRLFVKVPLPADLVPLALGEGSVNNAVLVVRDRREADYELVGRFDAAATSYAWVMPEARYDTAQARSVLPSRSRWVALTADTSAKEELELLALRLSKVKSWLTLAPPIPTSRQFPYRLVLQRQSDGKLLGEQETIRGADGRIIGVKGTIGLGEVWQAQLRAEPPPATMDERYFYLFSIDRCGRGTLLYPLGLAVGENRLPDRRTPRSSLQSPFPLGSGFQADAVTTETLFFISSATRIIAPEMIFTFLGVRKPGAPRPLDPLSALLFDVGENRAPGPGPLPPTEWSVQRLTFDVSGTTAGEAKCPF